MIAILSSRVALVTNTASTTRSTSSRPSVVTSASSKHLLIHLTSPSSILAASKERTSGSGGAITIGVAPTSMLLLHLALASGLAPIIKCTCPVQSTVVRSGGGINLLLNII